MAFVPAAADSMFRNHEEDHFPTSPPCPPQDFQGVSELLMRRSVQFSGMDTGKELQHDDDTSEDGSHMLGEKKRRLNLEQVRALEKSFELGNKLEPERKMQLARALGLQPRQIAIWFQNRRARWKTKQLEKGYDVLKKQFEALKADNDALKSQNKKLQTQLMALKTRESGRINLNKENEGSWSNGSENSCEVNLNKTSTDSTLYPPLPQHQTNENAPVMFPAPAPAGIMHLLHSSSNSRPGNNHPAPLSNAGFCNMFPGIEENPDFWSWSEHQTFH